MPASETIAPGSAVTIGWSVRSYNWSTSSNITPAPMQERDTVNEALKVMREMKQAQAKNRQKSQETFRRRGKG